MQDHEDIANLRTDPKEWDRGDVWQKLWYSATMAASRKLQKVSPAHVDDIAIQSIRRVIARLPNMPNIQKFGELRAFTTSVAYHLAISHLRQILGPERGGGKIGALNGNEDQLPDDKQISPADYLQIEERTRLVKRTLEELKPLNRKILCDFFLEGLKQKEIAAKHDMPIGTVGVYIQRALKEARGLLENDAKLLEDIRSTISLSVLVLIFLAL